MASSGSEPGPDRSLVIPMWNEAGRISATVDALARYCDGEAWSGGPLELVLVDDGSTDSTVAAAEQALATTGLAGRVVRLPARSGKGRAVQGGVLVARAPIVAFADADLSAGAEQIDRIFAAAESGTAGVCIASRTHPRSVIASPPPWQRRLAARLFNLAVRAAGLSDRGDTQCGLKAFDADAAAAIFEDLVASGFAFDVEVLVRADRLGFEVVEQPVYWAHDHDTSVRVLKDAMSTARDLVAIRRRYGSARRPRPA